MGGRYSLVVLRRHTHLSASKATPVGVEIILHPIAELMGGGFAACKDGYSFVVLDPDLQGPERRAALQHELIHLERGLADYQDAPAAWTAITKREEMAVEREVAARLVPQSALREHLRRLASLGEGVTANDVADEFEVPERIAAQALTSLTSPS